MNETVQQEQASGCGDRLSAPERRSEKSGWDKFEILSKPIAGLLTALAIALLGYWGQSTVTSIAAMDQNARLYTELLSKREQSESELRKDMFSVILKDFFKQEARGVASSRANGPTIIRSDEISEKLLKLEMLALNFGDSLSLGPLFLEVGRDILKAQPVAGEERSWLVKQGELMGRLQSLAKQVASSQLASLKSRGQSFEIEIPYAQVKKTKTARQQHYSWPDAEYEAITAVDAEAGRQLSEARSKLVQDKITRILNFDFSKADYQRKTLGVDLTVATIAADGQPELSASNMTFTLDFFNFPLINNTRLSADQRFALVLTRFDQDIIKLEGVLFPGEFSSQRDKPYLADAIKSLKKGGDLTGRNAD